MDRMGHLYHKEKQGKKRSIENDKQRKYTGMEHEHVDEKVKERFYRPAYKKYGDK